MGFLDRRNGLPAPGDCDSNCDLELARWVDRVLNRMPRPWKRTCLKRVTVLYYLLKHRGRAVALNVGVKRREDGELHAHAWLTLQGAPYLEPDLRSLEGLSEIAVFPS